MKRCVRLCGFTIFFLWLYKCFGECLQSFFLSKPPAVAGDGCHMVLFVKLAVLAVNIVFDRPKFRGCTHTQDYFFPAWGCMCDGPQLFMRFMTINICLSVLFTLIRWKICICFWLQPLKWMVWLHWVFFFMLGKPCSWSTFSQRWPHVKSFHGTLAW